MVNRIEAKDWGYGSGSPNWFLTLFVFWVNWIKWLWMQVGWGEAVRGIGRFSGLQWSDMYSVFITCIISTVKLALGWSAIDNIQVFLFFTRMKRILAHRKENSFWFQSNTLYIPFPSRTGRNDLREINSWRHTNCHAMWVVLIHIGRSMDEMDYGLAARRIIHL